MVNGGALAGERNVQSFSVDRDTRRLAFQAPREAGVYELRLYDRNSNHYILAVATFEVHDPRGPSASVHEYRFTPMPTDPPDAGLPLPTPTIDLPLGEPPAENPAETSDSSSSPSSNEASEPNHLWSADLEDVRDLFARQNGGMLDDAREANRLARHVEQLDRMLADSALSFPLTQEEIQHRLNDVEGRIAAAPESELADLIAERAVLQQLAGIDGAPVSEAAARDVRDSLFSDWQQTYDRFRESERARNATMQVLVGRTGALHGSSDEELGARLSEIQEGLGRPESFGLSASDLPILHRERADIQAELTRRQQERADHRQTQQKATRIVNQEITPALNALRLDLTRAADEEDVTVGYVLAGNEPLVDSSDNLNPAALAEESLFAQVAGLPHGQARTRTALDYLETWMAFNEKVAPTLEDRILADSYVEALVYNSQTRADMRVKAASLLAEEAPAIIAAQTRRVTSRTSMAGGSRASLRKCTPRAARSRVKIEPGAGASSTITSPGRSPTSRLPSPKLTRSRKRLNAAIRRALTSSNRHVKAG